MESINLTRKHVFIIENKDHLLQFPTCDLTGKTWLSRFLAKLNAWQEIWARDASERKVFIGSFTDGQVLLFSTVKEW